MIYDFKQKEINIRQSNAYMLAKTLSMFEYYELPETIPIRELEYLLQVHGYAFITEVEGELYAFVGGLGGEVDAYGKPQTITINNVFLNFNKTLSIKDDGVLIRNDSMEMGLLPLFNKYNSMLIENDINMVVHGYNTRLATLISASDDKTKASADAYMKKIIEGSIGVIGEHAFFDGVKVHSSSASSSVSVTDMTEYHQYIKAGLYNEIGLSLNFNMKQERLTEGESSQSEGSLFPFVYNMMENRLEAIEKVNEKYNTSWGVNFGSVWHQKHTELVDNIDNNETVLPTETTETPVPALQTDENEPLTNLDEPLNEPLTNLDEPLEDTPADAEIDNDNDLDIEAVLELLDDETLTDDDRALLYELLKELEGSNDD